jgi:hypothetical protein
VAFDLASQAGVMDKITELRAMPFRDLSNFAVLFLALAAAAALAWYRKFEVFEIGLLGFASVVSFRSLRDAWIMAIVAGMILASRVRVRQKAELPLPGFASGLAAIAAAFAIWVGFGAMHVNQKSLQTQMDESMPVRAVEEIRAKGYTGPLYNDFNWGGYLIWALRMPVSIDGRAAFYGDTAINRSVATWDGHPDWASDPALISAGIVIGPVKSPLMQLLRMDAHYKLVYADKVSAVFVPRR